MTYEMMTEEQWQSFHINGYLHLGEMLNGEEVAALKQRANDLALGVVKNPDVQFQRDTGGAYEDLPAAVPQFDKGTLLYRKIQGLENDELFLRLIKKPVCLDICAKIYGRHAAISLFRAMIMNNPAGQGTIMPWHQDGGNVWALDRDPLVTIWVALDDATPKNGCMDCIPGSHRLGLLSLYGSIVSDEHVRQYCPPDLVHPLEVKAGHAVLIHNWLIHRSGVNPSPEPRRAFTMCCMDARTRSTLTGHHFPIIKGSLPEESERFLKQIQDELATLRRSADEATEYARSLEAENKTLRRMREDAEKYAESLEEMRQEAEKYALSLEAERTLFLQKEAERREREELKRAAKLEAEQKKLAKTGS